MARRTGDIYSGARFPHSTGTTVPRIERPSVGRTIEGSHRQSATTFPTVIDEQTRKDLTQAGKQVKVWTAKRDELIRSAVEAGGSLREVGEAVGLSHTAVKFIAKGRG